MLFWIRPEEIFFCVAWATFLGSWPSKETFSPGFAFRLKCRGRPLLLLRPLLLPLLFTWRRRRSRSLKRFKNCPIDQTFGGRIAFRFLYPEAKVPCHWLSLTFMHNNFQLTCSWKENTTINQKNIAWIRGWAWEEFVRMSEIANDVLFRSSPRWHKYFHTSGSFHSFLSSLGTLIIKHYFWNIILEKTSGVYWPKRTGYWEQKLIDKRKGKTFEKWDRLPKCESGRDNKFVVCSL